MTGQLATSRAGHDRDTLYVIIAEEGDFVYLCDGRLKPPDKPKKKRRKHIQPIDSYVDENTLSVNVNRLRKKLESVGLVDFIQTKKYIGYRIG